MGTLNHLELPDHLFAAIRKRAAEQGISIEEQVVRDLSLAERTIEPQAEVELMKEVRAERERLSAKGVFLTEETLKRAKSWGRK